jgi:Tol biopolymer transport system component
MIHGTAGSSSTDATRHRSLKALIALVAVAAVSAPTAQATSPGSNGRIAFMRPDAHGLWQVWTANPDLTAAQQLTAGDATSGWPGWAPDAERIAFDSDRADPDPTDDVFVNDVFTMRADGSDVTKLTDSVGFSGDPAYSPDGELIAFDADRGIRSGDPGWTSANPDLSIYVTDATDGHPTRRVTTPPAGSSDTEPRFSPDGRKLVFTRFRGGSSVESGRRSPRTAGDTSAVFVVRVDGTRLRRITGWGARTGQADWSPDGGRIVFEDVGDYLGNADVYTVRADGSGLAKLTHGHGITGIGSPNAFQFDGFYDPVWSPDGTKVLLGHQLLEAEGAFHEGLATIDADGSNLSWAAPNPQIEHQPDWGTAPLR